VIDLDPLDEEADQVAPEMPVGLSQAVTDPLREVAQLSDDQGQGTMHGYLIRQVPPLVFQVLKAVAKAPDPRLELVPRDDLVGVAIDQTLKAAAQLGNLPLHRGQVRTLGAVGLNLVAPSLVLRPQTIGILE